MRFPRDAADWPHAETSRQVLVKPHRWHVQQSGNGPQVLLIHGAGGATQSFRGLIPFLRSAAEVIAVDLPGQGFTQSGAQRRCGLTHMSQDLMALIHAQGWTPQMIVGHSAGAAIALNLARLGLPSLRGIVGINAALAPFDGVAGWLFPLVAKALAVTPLSASLFATRASPASVRRLVEGTGSHLDPEGLRLYLQLARDTGHVDATLSMMAQWSLADLLPRLGEITLPVHLIIGEGDLAVPPRTSLEAARMLPDAHVTSLPGLGHLAHEEAPEQVAKLILTELQSQQ